MLGSKCLLCDSVQQQKLFAPSPSQLTFVSMFVSQVDPACVGRIGASDAALFLKKSGLADAVLGKVR